MRKIINTNTAWGPEADNLNNLLKIGKNLFDKSLINEGYYVQGTGGIASSPTYSVTDYIPVLPLTAYFLTSSYRVAYYTEAKVFVSYVESSGTPTVGRSVTTPAGCYYMRVQMLIASKDVYQVEVGTVATIYEAYKCAIDVANIKDGDIAASKIADGVVTKEKLSFIKTGKNLFDKNIVTDGKIVNGSTGLLQTSATYSASDYIAILGSTSYVMSGHGAGYGYVGFYDINKLFISGSSSYPIWPLTSPATAVYIRVSCLTANLLTAQLEVGTDATIFEEFYYSLNYPSGINIPLLQQPAYLKTGWRNKKWSSMGDSISRLHWQDSVAVKLGLLHTTYSADGTWLSGSGVTAMCNDARIDAMPADSDLITVLCGTNDWCNSIALGLATSINVTDFNGALNVLLSKLSTRFPAKRIVMLTTTYGEQPTNYGALGWANKYTNSAGLTANDYAEAIRLACKRWGIPYIDTNLKCGWNTVNITSYITDDGALLHPKAAGLKRISDVLLGGLMGIDPFI